MRPFVCLGVVVLTLHLSLFTHADESLAETQTNAATATTVLSEDMLKAMEGMTEAQKEQWILTHFPENHPWRNNHAFVGGTRFHMGNSFDHIFHPRLFHFPVHFKKFKPATPTKSDALPPMPDDLAASVVPKSSTVAESCAFELEGKEYDLSNLKLSNGSPEYASEDGHHNIYKLNVCGKSTSEGSDCQRSNGMVCQYSSSPMMKLERVIGRWGEAPYPKWSFMDPEDSSAGVKLTFANGDDCEVRGDKKPPVTEVFFSCDKDAGAVGTISAQEVQTCHYVVTIPTKYGCEGEAGMSSGWVFLFLLFFGFGLYVGVGCAYNHYRMQKPWGAEAFPNREFWEDLPNLVREGVAFSRAWVQKKMDERKQGSGGDHVPHEQIVEEEEDFH